MPAAASKAGIFTDSWLPIEAPDPLDHELLKGKGVLNRKSKRTLACNSKKGSNDQKFARCPLPQPPRHHDTTAEDTSIEPDTVSTAFWHAGSSTVTLRAKN